MIAGQAQDLKRQEFLEGGDNSGYTTIFKISRETQEFLEGGDNSGYTTIFKISRVSSSK
ncbi:9779_t:CDS:2, partial [Scutellospora calospora]